MGQLANHVKVILSGVRGCKIVKDQEFPLMMTPILHDLKVTLNRSIQQAKKTNVHVRDAN